ncbi:MAG: MBL fold metallo-hydrolase [Anaerolineales bacterium]|nr:MBL fold metallo-hydrolase [Anaerolineales bacterium]
MGLLRSEDPSGGLARQGVAPDQIDMVINTHLHADHCSGNTPLYRQGIGPTFPSAHYYVQRREYEDATHTNERTRSTYYEPNFQPLLDCGQMTLLDGDTDILRCARRCNARSYARSPIDPAQQRGAARLISERFGKLYDSLRAA